MKAKLVRGVAFFALFAVLFCGLNARYINTDYYQNFSLLGYYNHVVGQDLQIVNFGSSHAEVGIDYAQFPQLRAGNFAFSAQCPQVDAILMENFQQRFGEGCVVILPVVQFAFYTTTSMDIFHQRAPSYYPILDTSLIPNPDVKELIFSKYFPVLAAGEDIRHILETPNHWYTRYTLQGQLFPAEEYAARGQELVENWMAGYMPQGQTLVPAQWQAMQTMLDTCRENGWQPVVITCPVPQGFEDVFPAGYIDTFYDDLYRLLDENPGVPFWDYARDARIVNEAELFYDVDHLNEDGAKVFTRLLVEDCEKAGYLQM